MNLILKPYTQVANVAPNPDAIQEFSFQTNNYSAKFGGRGGSYEDIAAKAFVVVFSTVAEFGENFFRRKITTRRVVLVQNMHTDSINRRAGGDGQTFAEFVVSSIGDSQPVDGTQHDWLLTARNQNNASTGKR